MAALRSPQPASNIPHTPGPKGGHSRIPSLKSPANSSNILSNSSSGIPTFRSLRSLLPFGPNKESTPISASVSPKDHGHKSPFSTFGSSKKSFTRDRKASLETPVISIGRPESSPIRKSLSLTAFEKPLPSRPETNESKAAPSNSSDQDHILPIPSPGSPFAADLSTIIESDTSGISKHLPSASPSPSPSSSPGLESSLLVPPPSRTPQSENSELGNESSALDLSTTQLTAEVLNAFTSKDSSDAGAWRTDPKVVDTDDDTASESGGEQKHDISFNLDNLDPELAALLSPNRVSDNTIVPIAPQRRSSELKPRSTRSSPAPSIPSSPVRPSHSPTNPPSPRHPLLKLRPIPNRHASTNSSPDSLVDDQTSNESNTFHFLRPPPSPLSSSSVPTPSTSTTKLVTPRIASSGSSRFGLKSGSAAPSRSSIDVSRSPVSPRPSLDTPHRTRKRSMSVEGGLGSGMARAFSYSSKTMSSRHVDRPSTGTSLSSLSSRPPMTEWLGPRTAKAFRAAGLLSSPEDRDRSSPGPSSASEIGSIGRRFGFGSSGGSVSGSVSEFGVSGRGSLDGRGSSMSTISYRAYQSPSSTLMESPTFTASSRDRDTPRSASTAPTSVSTSSWRERDKERERDEITELKEKHSTETAALLGALSDSQRTAKVLREENADLRERMTMIERDFEKMGGDLETVERENEVLRRRVSELRTELREARVARLRNVGLSGVGEGKSSPLRYSSSPVTTDAEMDDEERHPVSTVSSASGRSKRLAPPKARRFSATSSSSVFHAPPPNMTMLNEEYLNLQPASDSSSYSPASPTIAIPLHIPREEKDGPVDNDVSISPTTANFSMHSGQGSPKSLFLRPEHELHLRDMESMDLGLTDDEEG